MVVRSGHREVADVVVFPGIAPHGDHCPSGAAARLGTGIHAYVQSSFTTISSLGAQGAPPRVERAAWMSSPSSSMVTTLIPGIP